ncbi:hypothetical protein G6F43_003639 [Rhizopus delemar]|nr:hypothetical protein G6F43_003639 [Rhizopus delemar]
MSRANNLNEQDENLPTDLSSLQDIFSFRFFEGRPITNILLAILWSIGLPILLYELLKPRLGQVVSMIIASCPPLIIVISRMIKTRKLDILGFVAGISFLISGIISIAQPSEQVSSICESIVPLLVGVFCLLSLIPIKIGGFELRPLIYSITNQLMPRVEMNEDLASKDKERIDKTNKAGLLDWVYTHMAKIRNDVRILTAGWGIILIIGFIVKAIIASTTTDISKAQNFGYIFFTLATVVMIVISWLFMKLMKKHVGEQSSEIMREGCSNTQWGINTLSNGFNQIIG